MLVKAIVFACVIAACAAERSCPPDAAGDYPRCVCNHYDFIFVDDACVRVDRTVCPPPAVKHADREGCRCPDPKDFFDDYYWFCRTKLYLPTTTTPRPTISTTYIPRCPAYHTGTYPDCVRIPCGNDQPGKYVPNCNYVTYKPVTYKPFQVCPTGQTGVYPNCQYPCPPHQLRKEYNGVCEPIPCTKGRGWTGDFMPDCKYTPFCPDEFPGHYPYCNRYALNVTTTTTTTTRKPITYLPPPPPSPSTTRRTTTTTTTRRPPPPPPSPSTTTTRRPPPPPPPTPKRLCDSCECCESVQRDVQKILRIFETLYGKDVIDSIGTEGTLKKPFLSRVADQLPRLG